MRWIALLFVLIPVGCALAAVGVSTLLPPVYGAQADLILKPRIELSDAAAERVMLTEEAVLTSPRVLVPVATQGQRSLKAMKSAVTTAMVGRSSVLRVTVEDRDKAQAQFLLQSIIREYGAVHAKDSTIDPSTLDSPLLTYSVLTPPRLLDEPVGRRPLAAMAAGTLIGLVIASAAALFLLRPGRSYRPPSRA